MKRAKLSRKMIGLILTAAVVAAITASLLVLNIFIPVRYLSAYVVFSKQTLPENSSRVTWIDVGYGDCTLVELPDGKILLLDGGDGSYSHELKLLSVLNRRGIGAIDYLVCTSVNAEHCGGLIELLRYQRVGEIFLPYCLNRSFEQFTAFRNAAEESGALLSLCEFGAGESGEGWQLVFLSPSASLAGGETDLLNESPAEGNVQAASAVVWLSLSGVNFLFLSDADATVQDKLLSADAVGALTDGQGEPIALETCDVMQIADHGATDGMFAPLYELAKPRAAVVSSDGQISEESRTLLQTYSDLYETATDGTVTFTLCDGDYRVTVNS